MEIIELLKKRYSVRNYKETKVENEKIALILEAGRVAPTAANMQPQRFLVVKTSEGLEKLSKVTKLHNPPLAIIVCSDRENVWKRSYDGKDTMDIDATIATDHMMIQAEALGLGSCWVASFDPVIIKKEFNIPDNLEAINLLEIGYADEEAKSPDRHNKLRKPIEDMVFYETF